ncbi:hypothetical protein HY621_00360 [Candidatus Uhrbacteria bacterium]|nr:hypothetical protein [Candidatus Uhrbacteria bacterium]
MVILRLILIIGVAFFPLYTHALAFNPNTVLSDEDFFNTDTLSADAIQRLLERKGSALAAYNARDIDGVQKRAADIIWRAAQTHGINPQVLIVVLQKEQSLIENPHPSQYSYDWATGFARCDSCTVDDPRVAANKGFVTQVEKAAWRKKYYTLNPDQFQFKPGTLKIVDGLPVTPTNWATAALYNYTPHIRGNYSFWKLWNRYFSKVFPDGMIVKTSDDPQVWLIQNGKRRLFTSLSVFLSRFNEKNIVEVPHTDLETYEIDTPLKFPQYSLLQSPKGSVFLFMDDRKYGIQSKEVFRKIGYQKEEIITATQQDIDNVPTAGIISDPLGNPVGSLLQDKKTGAVYYVLNGSKHPIIERSVLTTNFSHNKIMPTKTRELAAMPNGEPIKFVDGTLVSSPASPTIYLISNGQKRPFLSPDAFTALGFAWSQVVQTNGSALDLHEEGNPIDLGKIVDDYTPPPITSTASAPAKLQKTSL